MFGSQVRLAFTDTKVLGSVNTNMQSIAVFAAVARERAQENNCFATGH